MKCLISNRSKYVILKIYGQVKCGKPNNNNNNNNLLVVVLYFFIFLYNYCVGESI